MRRSGAFSVTGFLLLTGLALGGVSPGGAASAVSPKPSAPLLLPNVRALPARDLSIVHTDDGRYLRFESALANVGRGPLEVQPNDRKPCPAKQRHASQIIYRDVDGSGFFNRSIDTVKARRSAGCMVHHPTHDHWHFRAAARYELLRPATESPLIARKKMSFCLRDSSRVPPSWMTSPYGAYYGACSRTRRQGISIGWADVYQSYLPGQSLPLPPSVGDGVYCVRTKSDAKDSLVESLEDDNVSLQAIRITGDQVSVIKRSRCASVR